MDKPFTSDGCSGFMSFLWQVFSNSAPPWEGCCITHDKAYWEGGPLHLRLEADRALRDCVKANGYPVTAWIMFLGVRVGGVYWLPFPSARKVAGKWLFAFDGVRWGYGYKYPRYR